MTIDTKELRRLAQAATPGGWYVEHGNYVYGRKVVTDGEEEWHPVIACADDGETNVNFEGNAAFIAAANPAAISELLDRLEAAESARRDDYQNWMTALDRNAELLAKLEAAEKEVESIRQGITFRDDVVAALAMERDALRAKIAEMGQPGAKWFDWLPQGTTHISSIMTVTSPCFGLDARFNAFKYIDGVLYTYRTDSDNKYGKWVKAASEYRDDVLPTIYPLSGAKGEEK